MSEDQQQKVPTAVLTADQVQRMEAIRAARAALMRSSLGSGGPVDPYELLIVAEWIVTGQVLGKEHEPLWVGQTPQGERITLLADNLDLDADE